MGVVTLVSIWSLLEVGLLITNIGELLDTTLLVAEALMLEDLGVLEYMLTGDDVSNEDR